MHAAAFFDTYHWLVANNLWKDVIQLFVAAIFGFVLGRGPWKHLKKRQAANQSQIMDRLDAETPGGLGDLAVLLKLLPQAEAAENLSEEGEHT